MHFHVHFFSCSKLCVLLANYTNSFIGSSKLGKVSVDMVDTMNFIRGRNLCEHCALVGTESAAIEQDYILSAYSST